jgi:hypothetical protein
LAGGIGYSGVGEPPAYGNYGSGGYNPYMLPYRGGGTGYTPYDPNATPGGPSTGGNGALAGGPAIATFTPDIATFTPAMAYGGQVPKMQEGGEVPTKTAQRMTSIAEMLKTLRES